MSDFNQWGWPPTSPDAIRRHFIHWRSKINLRVLIILSHSHFSLFSQTQNDSEKLDTNATQSDTEQPEGSTTQTCPSQRPHRGGSTGRGRRGAHSGSQRQAASQRRDHRINQNQPRVNQQNNNNNPRRHPDDDNDNHGTPSNSNNNAATSTTTVTTTSTEHSSTNKGESTGGGSSGSTPNESGGGGQQQNHQQQSGTVDSLGIGSNKLRSHAHSGKFSLINT